MNIDMELWVSTKHNSASAKTLLLLEYISNKKNDTLNIFLLLLQ